MRNIGPFGLENRIFAGICGLGALLFALILFGWGFFGSLIFGMIVGVIVLIWLLMRADDSTGTSSSGETSQGSTAAGTVTPTSAAAAAPAPQADVVKTEAPVAAPEAVDTPVVEETVAPAPVEAEVETPAETTETTEVAAPKVKESTKLPGQDDLESRKGEWKYEASETAPAAKDVAEAAPAAADSGDIDYDGDGVIEGENEGSKPATLSAARDGGADDLKQIKGVGPKMEGMLNGMGFFHFDQVAAWTGAEVAWVDANLKGFRGRVSRDNWVDQAKTLAAGGETEFSKKVEKGGVY
jgi:predicted flap endonuclease-1-like 5' DNA nuclease